MDWDAPPNTIQHCLLFRTSVTKTTMRWKLAAAQSWYTTNSEKGKTNQPEIEIGQIDFVDSQLQVQFESDHWDEPAVRTHNNWMCESIGTFKVLNLNPNMLVIDRDGIPNSSSTDQVAQ